MSFFDRLFGKRERSSDLARERLLTVLVHDRIKLTPEMMEQLKVELSAVIARYVDHVDPDQIAVTLSSDHHSAELHAEIPLRRHGKVP